MNKSLHRWADARETIPASFQAAFNQTLNSLQEEQPVKKNIARTALLAALITALLLGTAYAVMNAAGLMDTYHTTPLAGTKKYIQTDFDQIAYENDLYTVRVVEALTDGVTARIMFEYAAKDKDALVVSEIEDDECTIDIGPAHTKKRVYEWAKDASRVIRISLPGIKELEEDGTMGSDTHVSPNVMRVWWEFPAPKEKDALLTATDGYEASPGEWVIDGEWQFRLKNTMDQTRVVKVDKLDSGILHLTDMTITFTPIYTYVDYTMRVDGIDAVQAAHGVVYGDFYDAEGNPIKSGGGHGSDMDENGTAIYRELLQPVEEIPERFKLKYTRRFEIDEEENLGPEMSDWIDIPLK